MLPSQKCCLLIFVSVCFRSTELVKNFTEDCYSVAVHPNGLIVLLGFADKLRLMTVLMDDFRWATLSFCLSALLLLPFKSVAAAFQPYYCSVSAQLLLPPSPAVAAFSTLLYLCCCCCLLTLLLPPGHCR